MCVQYKSSESAFSCYTVVSIICHRNKKQFKTLTTGCVLWINAPHMFDHQLSWTEITGVPFLREQSYTWFRCETVVWGFIQRFYFAVPQNQRQFNQTYRYSRRQWGCDYQSTVRTPMKYTFCWHCTAAKGLSENVYVRLCGMGVFLVDFKNVMFELIYSKAIKHNWFVVILLPGCLYFCCLWN